MEGRLRQWEGGQDRLVGRPAHAPFLASLADHLPPQPDDAARGAQHRFAFARNGPAASVEAFRQALAVAGVRADTPATVLCDGDAGLWRLQRGGVPRGLIVVGWWGAGVRFEDALQNAPRPWAGPGRTHPPRRAGWRP